MEDDNNWHYRIPNAEEVRRALQGAGPRMRNAFADEITQLARPTTSASCCLSGDIGNRLFDEFKRLFPSASSTAASPRPT